MGSRIDELILIDVKNGDAFPENRLSGHSMTGTYFLASSKDFEKIEKLLSNCSKFYFDFYKIRDYSILFKLYFYKYSNKYKDNMKDFEKYCNKLLELSRQIDNVNIKIRTNDSRNFFRFENNDDEAVDYFRHILYAEFTQIVLHFDGSECKIYPMISNYQYFDMIKEEVCEEF